MTICWNSRKVDLAAVASVSALTIIPRCVAVMALCISVQGAQRALQRCWCVMKRTSRLMETSKSRSEHRTNWCHQDYQSCSWFQRNLRSLQSFLLSLDGQQFANTYTFVHSSPGVSA